MLSTLRDLGWRLRHHIAAQAQDPDQIAGAAGITPDDFALILSGHQDLAFSTLSTILDTLGIEWWHLFGADRPHPPAVHDLSLESSAWHAIEGGIQTFDVRRDERYRTGDVLRLHEKVRNHATGRVLTVEVTHLMYFASVGLPAGYVALALRPPGAAFPTRELR